MQDLALGRALRALRRRRGWRQRDLARAARLSTSTISRAERGLLHGLTLGSVRAIAAALEVRLELHPRWRGAGLDRLLDGDHARRGASVIEALQRLGWACRPEVSFSVYGERGVIDILAWHAPAGALLVIELKTAIVDLQALLAAMDRKQRLAAGVARSLGWEPASVSGWVVVSEGRTNRRRAVQHRSLLRAAFPHDGRAMRRWVRSPRGPIRALSLWPDSPVRTARSGPGRGAAGGGAAGADG